ncbi:hypothetical protein AAZX31_02G262400 [Glycine max]
MSVPQFGGWDQNEPGAIDYTVMFTQARENKKHQKANLIEIRRKSFGSERDFVNSNHGRAPRHHVRSHTHSHAHEDHVVMGKKRILTYINCCIRPTIAAT